MKSESGFLNWVIETFGVVFIAIMIAAIPSRACAQVCAPDVTHRSERLTLNGDDGAWFHHDVVACMLHDLALIPELNRRLVLVRDKLTVREGQRQSLLAASAAADVALSESDQAIDLITRRAVEAEDGEGTWRWLALIGTAVGFGIGIFVGASL